VSRHDAMFTNTMSSSSAGGLKSRSSIKRKEEAESEKAKQSKPEPRATVILKLMEHDKQQLMNAQSILLDDDLSDEEKGRIVAQRRRDYDYICSLERRFRKLLRLDTPSGRKRVGDSRI
jgi:hypothetical protein